MQLLLWLVIILTSILILFIYNETTLFWKESDHYQESDPSKLFHKECASAVITSSRQSAVLCLHGFPATPDNFKYIIPRLAEEYDVYAPLLPGMGTDPHDMLSQTYSGWYAFARKEYLDLKKQYKQVFLLGISMGGSLCLKLGQEFCSSPKNRPQGIALCSTPVFINAFLKHGIIHRFALYFSRILKNILPSYIPLKGKTLQMEDNASVWQGYHGIFLTQIHSLKMGLKKADRRLYKIDCPLYLGHSLGDRTVPFANMNHILKKVSSHYVERRIVDTRPYKHTHHVLFLYDSVRDQIIHDIISFYRKIDHRE